jgi:hypothetical protein
VGELVRRHILATIQRQAALAGVAVAIDHLRSVPERVAVVDAVMHRTHQCRAGIVVGVAVPEGLVRLIGGASAVVGGVHVGVGGGGAAFRALQRAGQAGAGVGAVDPAVLREEDLRVHTQDGAAFHVDVHLVAHGVLAAQSRHHRLVGHADRAFGRHEVDLARRCR